MTDETDTPEQPATSRWFGKRRHDPGLFTQAARDSITVSRAFGPAYERDGVRVIPVARVMGGTSSGYCGGSVAAGPSGAAGPGAPEQSDEATSTPAHRGGRRDASGTGDGYGGGGGFGVVVKPLGVVVIDDSGTHWQPTIDINRAILGGQIVAALAVLTAGCVLARRHTTVHRLGLPMLPALPRFMHHHHRVDAR